MQYASKCQPQYFCSFCCRYTFEKQKCSVLLNSTPCGHHNKAFSQSFFTCIKELEVHNIYYTVQYASILVNDSQMNSAPFLPSTQQQCNMLLFERFIIAPCRHSLRVTISNTAKIIPLFPFQIDFCQISVVSTLDTGHVIINVQLI